MKLKDTNLAHFSSLQPSTGSGNSSHLSTDLRTYISPAFFIRTQAPVARPLSSKMPEIFFAFSPSFRVSFV